MQVTLLSTTDYQRSTWKNGLGFTDQIAIFPPGADLRRSDFLWRLSSARIERAAPFSLFPNHDRVLVILEGAGVTLKHVFDEGGAEDAVEVVDLDPLVAYEFPGDVSTSCELKDGPVQDLSVFFAKGQVMVQAEILHLDKGATFGWEAPGETQYIFVVKGDLNALNQKALPRETLKIESEKSEHAEALELVAGPEGVCAVLISIEQG